MSYSIKNLGRCLLRGTAIFLALFTVSAVRAQDVAALDLDHPKAREVLAVQRDVTASLMQQPEIIGTAIGLDDADEPVLVIYVNRDAKGASEAKKSLPARMRGVGVRLELTDKFVAYRGRPGGGGGGTTVSHTALQAPPIQLGTSGGWRSDLANGYCCGGTLGALVKIGDEPHILSNYHVFESDIVNGGNGTTAQTDDHVIQPALIDVSCNASDAQNVATLVKKSALPGSNLDCSVAKVVSGMVRADGAILEIGTISSQTAGASLKKAVKKSGRTTGLTRSSISGLNATISVAYENECAGGAAFTKTFTGQIVIANKGSGFLAGGDSGSLMVEDVATNPRAVGLLYAGSSTSAIANPINEVLTFLGATMVGN